MAELKMDLDGLTCDHCVANITGDLLDVPGIDRVEIERTGVGLQAVAQVSGSALPDDNVLIEVVEDAGNYSVRGIQR